MCDPITIITLSAVALSAGSAIQQGNQQKEWNNYQAKQAIADGNAEKSAATLEADKIRKMARIQAGEANSALASSGVQLGEGTAVKIDAQIAGNAEEDAVTTIFGGSNRQARSQTEAMGLRLKGRQAQTAGYVSATSTLLAASSNSGKGWK